MKEHLRRWGAVYILAVVWSASWAGQLIAMAVETSFSWAAFWASTFENWESEFLQLGVQALLVVGFAHVVFAKSTEDMERLEEKVDRLTELVKEGPGA